MPEFVEAEAYRRTLDPVIGGQIVSVDVVDERLVRHVDHGADAVISALTPATVQATRRTGKVVFVDVSSGHTLALGFGLRGRLVLDGRMSSPSGRWHQVQVRPEHVRLVVDCRVVDQHGHAVLRRIELEDQLRLATVGMDPDERSLGPDIMSLAKVQLKDVTSSSRAAVKSLLMDQRAIAGIGNLIADEILYQGGLDPRRVAAELDEREFEGLWTGVRRTRRRVLERGGSHHGAMIQSGSRSRGATCPRCKVEIERVRVGGRTSYFCPSHQV